MSFLGAIRNFRSLVPRSKGLLFFASAVLIFHVFSISAVSQISVVTQHYDNVRTGQNTQETILTPANVNSVQFGKLFTQNLDGQMPGQPLYVPNVFIPALNSTHNVVYAATMHDSVYAFDADSNQGSNALPLWQVSFLDSANGVTTVPQSDEGCSVGYTEFGIQGTPVIDPTQNAMYLVAVTKENGSYVHRLHALDLGTGEELFGGPVVITASVVVSGTTYAFVDKYQQQRTGLLLQNGVVSIGFGSPGCNKQTEMGWVMGYGQGTLKPAGAFDASPGVDASAVWLSGGGLAGDGAGNIYFSTGDGLFDGPGGTHFGDSVLKLTQDNGELNLADSFTPYNQLYFQQNDLDVSSGLVQLLPEQPDGSNFVLAIDKNGTAYLLDQNNLGGYDPAGDFQIPQELAVPVLGEVHAGLTYWNNTIYIAAYTTQVMAYSFTKDRLSLQPTSQTPEVTSNPQGGIVSSNGVQNGIFWYVSSPTSKLFAFNANNLATEYYDSAMAGKRDTLSAAVNFEMPIVANGRVYVDGKTQLTVFGLLPAFIPSAGNNQTAAVGTTLPIAFQAVLQDPYSGKPIQTSGILVTFTANGKAGSFSNPNAVTNSSGIATTSYTLSDKPGTYTITASSVGYASATYTVTATTGPPATFSIDSGNSQKAALKSPLPLPLSVKVKDAHGNAVSGVSVTFTDGGAGGSFSQLTATTDASGVATTSYTTGTVAGVVDITASMAGLPSVVFKETVLAGTPVSLAISSGNNQTVKTGAATGKLLQVLIEDRYGNPVPGISVTYSDGGAGGSFSVDPAVTSSKGIAGSRYTASNQEGTVTVTASAPGLPSVLFTIIVD
jgi:hypothetical protein